MPATPGMREASMLFAKFTHVAAGVSIELSAAMRVAFPRCFTISEPLAYLPTCRSGPELGERRSSAISFSPGWMSIERWKGSKWLHRLHTCGFNGGRFTVSRATSIPRRSQAESDLGTSRGRPSVRGCFGRIRHRLLKLEPVAWAPTHRDFLLNILSWRAGVSPDWISMSFVNTILYSM